MLYSGVLRGFSGIVNDPRLAVGTRAHAMACAALADCRAAFRANGKDPDAAGTITTPHDPLVDFEDCWEDRLRLSAAWRASGGSLRFWGNEDVTEASGQVWTRERLSRRMGPVRWDETGGRHGADRHLRHPMTVRHSGRPCVLAGLAPHPSEVADYPEWLPDSVDAADVMADLAELGFAHAVLKNSQSKSGIWRLPVSIDPEVNRRVINDTETGLGWTTVRLSGVPEMLLVQAWVPLEHEYRVFVVDGVPVSGAGCIEEFTPLDSLSGVPFDVRTRRLRGHLGTGEPSPIETVPGLSSRYELFVRMALELSDEPWARGTFVVDLAVRADTQEIVVVEVNELSNSGLYASDPYLVASAIATAADRGYTHLQEG